MQIESIGLALHLVGFVMVMSGVFARGSSGRWVAWLGAVLQCAGSAVFLLAGTAEAHGLGSLRPVVFEAPGEGALWLL